MLTAHAIEDWKIELIIINEGTLTSISINIVMTLSAVDT
jgi:hypothetical protein